MADLEEQEKVLSKYLSENQVLIIDAISSGRKNISSCLTKFGSPRSQITMAGSIHEAREEIQKSKPKVIFADFMIGKESSLDLIQFQKAQYEKQGVKDTLFVLVTSNASQSAVAQAAEEDVDTFIIKPFSLDTMKKAVARTVYAKINPTTYMQTIEEGKQLLFEGKYRDAAETFKKAIDLDEKPTLAYFYHGQADYMAKALEAAEKSYQNGLSLNNIHYKCLVGLFDLLHGENRFDDAYEVMKKLANYFPANPNRLSSVLRLSVQTKNYDDVDAYYRIFVEIESRSDELVKYMCSALAVTGRHYLQSNSVPKAIQAFESGAISAAGRAKYLLYMIEALAEYGLVKETEPFLKRLKYAGHSGPEMATAQFITLDESTTPVDVVNRGRNLINDGIEHPAVYEKLIHNSIQAGFKDSALELAKKAMTKWPERAKQFLRGFTAEELKSIGII
jgi:CheY-like chemotaxis protein